VYLSVGRITKGLVLTIALLLIAHLISEAVAALGHEPLKLRHFFSLNMEANPGAWFSSVQLLFCAILLTVIARKGYGNSHPAYWGVLAIVFYYLALDEGAQIHELLTPIANRSLGSHVRHGWVIIVLPIVAVVGLFSLRFLFQLPRWVAIQFLIGGVIYV